VSFIYLCPGLTLTPDGRGVSNASDIWWRTAIWGPTVAEGDRKVFEIIGESGQAFGAGIVSAASTPQIRDVPPGMTPPGIWVSEGVGDGTYKTRMVFPGCVICLSLCMIIR